MVTRPVLSATDSEFVTTLEPRTNLNETSRKVLCVVTYLYFGSQHVACNKILSFPLLQDDSLSIEMKDCQIDNCLTLAVLERNFYT